MAICLALTKNLFLLGYSWPLAGWALEHLNSGAGCLPSCASHFLTGTERDTDRGDTLTDRDIRTAQKLLPLENIISEWESSAPWMHPVLSCEPLPQCLCICGGMLVGVTTVNRSICLLGSLFCAHWFTSSSLHSSVFPSVSLQLLY